MDLSTASSIFSKNRRHCLFLITNTIMFFSKKPMVIFGFVCYFLAALFSLRRGKGRRRPQQQRRGGKEQRECVEVSDPI